MGLATEVDRMAGQELISDSPILASDFVFQTSPSHKLAFLDLCLTPLAIESQVCQGKNGPSVS